MAGPLIPRCGITSNKQEVGNERAKILIETYHHAWTVLDHPSVSKPYVTHCRANKRQLLGKLDVPAHVYIH